MKLRFLGTGTSFGIPVIGCDCAACTSADPRDTRFRHGAVIQNERTTILIDTPPELRLQLLAANVSAQVDIRPAPDWVEQLPIDDVEPIRAQLDAFVDAVTLRSRPVVSAEDGLAAVELAQRIVACLTPGMRT